MRSTKRKHKPGDLIYKVVPFTKIDASIDPTTGDEKREVYGMVTAVLPDGDEEVCDYDTSKPYYDKRVAEQSERSKGLSLFAMREMHQLSAIGRCIVYAPDDKKKQIHMGFKVVDDEAWKKIKEGVYTGFSHGGKLVGKMWKDPDFPGCMRYTIDPVEVSAVDVPCLGEASYDYVRADGAVEVRKFRSTKTDNNQRGLARKRGRALNKETNVRVQKYLLDEQIETMISSKIEARGLDKGMYAVSQLASLLQTLCWMRVDAEYEADVEQDGSQIPELLQQDLESLIETFLVMAQEETDELAAYGKAGGGTQMKNTLDELIKTANKSLSSHFKKAAAHHDKLADVHKAMADNHGELKDAMKDADEQSDVHKSVAKFAQKMEKAHTQKAAAHAAHSAHLSKMADNCAAEGEKTAEPDTTKTTEATTEKAAAGEKQNAQTTQTTQATEAPVQKSLAEQMKDEIEKATQAQLEAWKQSDEFKEMVSKRVSEAKESIVKDADGELKRIFGDRLQPTAAAAGKPQLVGREGQEIKTGETAKAAGSKVPTNDANVPLDLVGFVETVHEEN